MAELWSLLHFIMPSLFDSHHEFNEWFSKDIENKAANKAASLNHEQLSRLHMILKPFMLRRIKKDVENELADKIEIQVDCLLSGRQQHLYDSIKRKISVEDLLGASLSSSSNSKQVHGDLMNLVMQFRKVCNHPDLFKRRDVISPFMFEAPRWSPIERSRPKDVDVAYCSTNAITIEIPRLVFHELMQQRADHGSIGHVDWLCQTHGVLTPHHIYRSLFPATGDGERVVHHDSMFSILRFAGLSAALVSQHTQSGPVEGALLLLLAQLHVSHHTCSPFADGPTGTRTMALITPHATTARQLVSVRLPSPYTMSKLSAAIAKVIAAPILPIVHGDRAASTLLETEPRCCTVLTFGVAALVSNIIPPTLANSCDLASQGIRLLPPKGVLGTLNPTQGPPMSLHPKAGSLLTDCHKMQRLDALLAKLKRGKHRVLIYSQMTKMLDLLEEFMVYRHYGFVRLDGSSKLHDRRDMVSDFQNRSDIFAFLLSTRAGGLGINLTAADTVIFYDSDWNPTVDQQAMDRAHRVGQTKQVNSLLSKETPFNPLNMLVGSYLD